jgi:hypothetical protein
MPTRGQPRPVHHPVFARFYARANHLMDAEVIDHRSKLLAVGNGCERCVRR